MCLSIVLLFFSQLSWIVLSQNETAASKIKWRSTKYSVNALSWYTLVSKCYIMCYITSVSRAASSRMLMLISQWDSPALSLRAESQLCHIFLLHNIWFIIKYAGKFLMKVVNIFHGYISPSSSDKMSKNSDIGQVFWVARDTVANGLFREISGLRLTWQVSVEPRPCSERRSSV